MKKTFFIIATLLPLFSFSQILKELPKVEIPKIETPNLKIPEIKIPEMSNVDFLKAQEIGLKYSLLIKKPDTPELYTILVKKPIENVEKILIAKPK